MGSCCRWGSQFSNEQVILPLPRTQRRIAGFFLRAHPLAICRPQTIINAGYRTSNRWGDKKMRRAMTRTDENTLITHATQNAETWRPLTEAEFVSRYGQPTPKQMDRISQYVHVGKDGLLRPNTSSARVCYFVAMAESGTLYVATFEAGQVFWEKLGLIDSPRTTHTPLNASHDVLDTLLDRPKWAVDFYTLPYTDYRALVSG